MSDRIIIKKSDSPLGEDVLTRWESEGLTLISVNHVVTHEYPPWSGSWESRQEVVRWVYHFKQVAQ